MTRLKLTMVGAALVMCAVACGGIDKPANAPSSGDATGTGTNQPNSESMGSPPSESPDLPDGAAHGGESTPGTPGSGSATGTHGAPSTGAGSMGSGSH